MIFSLQIFRGFAAIAVAAYHLSIMFGDERYIGTRTFESVTWRMNLGVDFFFVLSGFIIMMAHKKDVGKPSQFIEFLKKRFTRIYPIYWLYVGIFCGLAALGFSSKSVNPDTMPKWLTVITLVPFENFKLPISQAWTLFHEITFYFIFSFLILHKRLGIVLFMLWQLLCLLNFTYAQPENRTAINTYFSMYNLDFLIGMFVYSLYEKKFNLKPLYLTMYGLITFFIIMYLETQGYIDKAAFFPYALCFGLFILAAVSFERSHNLFQNTYLVLLGNSSYSIYLTHEAFEGLFVKTWIKLLGLPFLKLHPYTAYSFTLLLTLIAGCILYILIERHLLKFTKYCLGQRQSL